VLVGGGGEVDASFGERKRERYKGKMRQREREREMTGVDSERVPTDFWAVLLMRRLSPVLVQEVGVHRVREVQVVYSLLQLLLSDSLSDHSPA
jgi:hypothetical protein